MTIENNLNLSQYPPPPVLWLTALIDTGCYPLQCTNWRSSLGISADSWLNAKVPSLLQTLPNNLSFQDFLLQQQQQQQEEGLQLPSDETTTRVTLLFQSMYKYAFDTSSTSLGDLSTPTAIVVLFCLVFILRLIKALMLPSFSHWGRLIGRKTHGVEWENANEERIAKFGEYIFRLLYHSSISVYGVYYFWDKEWWSFKEGATLSLYQGFPNHPVEPGMAWYYLLQAAYNVDAMLSLLELSFQVHIQNPFANKSKTTKSSSSISSDFGLYLLQFPIRISWSKTVRGDFQEMMIHHLVTNLLVIGSSVCRLTRIGSMVFLVHDLSDVPVDLSKLANFLKWKWTTLSCFLSMVMVWMATRLYILPFTIYRSILTESQHVLQEGLPPILYVHYRYLFYFLVGLLILLHVAWFVMFLQMFATFVKKKECHDLSEHKKGETQNGSCENKMEKEANIEISKNMAVEQSTAKPKRLQNEIADEKKDN